MNIDRIFIDVLHEIHKRLKNSGVNWAVTGSLGFALQGVRVHPHDVDIQTDKEGAYRIESLFPEFVVEKVSYRSSEKIRSYFGVLNIHGIRVEIMGDLQKKLENGTWEPPVDISKYKRFVEIDGMEIPVLSLEYEYQAYLKLGRMEKAEILRKFLNGQK